MPAEIFQHALTSYFGIIDPIGSALIFHSLTGDDILRRLLGVILAALSIQFSRRDSADYDRLRCSFPFLTRQ